MDVSSRRFVVHICGVKVTAGRVLAFGVPGWFFSVFQGLVDWFTILAVEGALFWVSEGGFLHHCGADLKRDFGDGGRRAGCLPFGPLKA
ncbi:hypothetical protein ECTOBSL9_0760 [Ectothiorhodospira sp. BSL-9]|nr:hypothetical protein ECTOBSL9_0760 [Ectothiorhodospira sp. BSL-9]